MSTPWALIRRRTRRGTGWIPDRLRHDSRDRDVDRLSFGATALPDEVSHRPFVTILDQLRTESCVAHTWMQLVHAAEWKRDGKPAPLRSRLFAYYNARGVTYEEHVDAGTYLRSCAKALISLGCPAESVWPFSDDPKTVNHHPPVNAYRLAHDFVKLEGYYRIFDHGPNRSLAVRAALAAGHLVGLGTVIDAAFMDSVGPVVVGVPADHYGKHAMAVCGYARVGGEWRFLLANSWGTGYRDGGFVWMREEYLCDDRTEDLWVGRLVV